MSNPVYTEPGAYNPYLPGSGFADASAFMMSAYGRDVKTFAVNRWHEIRPVVKTKGYFLRWKSEQAGRSRYSDLRDSAWAEGTPRPRGQNNLEQFAFIPYQTKRYQDSFTIGSLTLGQAGWPLQNMQTQMIGQKMMTERTIFAANALANATWNTNQANVDGAGGNLNGNAALLPSGQNFTNGTTTTPNIKIAFQKAFNIIKKVTLNAVNINDIVVLISPDTAIQMAQSEEINYVMAHSQYALPNVTGDLWYNEEYALPDRLYKFRIVVDATVYLDTRKTLSDAPLSSFNWVIPTGSVYFLTIPEARNEKKEIIPTVRDNMVKGTENLPDGESDAANFYPVLSTLVGFYQEEFTMEGKEEPFDRLVMGACTTNFDMQLSSWKGGFQMLRALG